MTGKYVAKKFKAAFAGLHIAFITDNSFKIHFSVALLLLIFGVVIQFSFIEWIIILFAISFVVVSELFNTAIEYLVRMFTQEYHALAEKLLDISAGAVLFATFTSIIAGGLIIINRIMDITSLH